MINGQIYYNHANAKTEEDYWYGVFYPLFLKGKTESEIKKLYSQPTLKKRKEAYNAGLALAKSDYNIYLSALEESYRKGAGDVGSGVIVTADGKVVDLDTGQIIDRNPENNSNVMLYVLIGVAGLVLFLIFRKKKG